MVLLVGCGPFDGHKGLACTVEMFNAHNKDKVLSIVTVQYETKTHLLHNSCVIDFNGGCVFLMVVVVCLSHYSTPMSLNSS